MVAPIAHNVRAILRMERVRTETGYSRSALYAQIQQGLFVRPVALGARAVGWPAGEVAALNAARIAGLSENDIRELVERLHAGRKALAEELPALAGH